MKRKCACLSKVKSEALFLEKFWLPHYSKFFEPQDLHVHAELSADGTEELCEKHGVSLTKIPPGAVPHGKNNLYIVEVIDKLLKDYECVLFAESPDDVIIPGPDHDYDIGKYVSGFLNSHDPYRFLTCYNVTHRVDSEPAYDPNKGTLLSQRGTFIRIPQFDNSFLWKVKPTWGRGWHDLVGVNDNRRIIGGGDTQGDGKRLYNFHIHYADFDLCNARHKVRMQTYSEEERAKRLYTVNVDNELHDMMSTMISDPQRHFSGVSFHAPQAWMRNVI